MNEEDAIAMQVVNPHAAGIDVGSRSHWVAVGQQENDVREFGVFNQDLFDMDDWLTEKNMRTIAMESTETYWQNLYAVLISKASGNFPLPNILPVGSGLRPTTKSVAGSCFPAKCPRAATC
ncbi:MAG: hypothetical protein KatS3mg031_1645 [Chitinophagales bacterium]|nr:MAG: hypothetical protein KatS3mg031_1645 [Chitinophagales bacterium]